MPSRSSSCSPHAACATSPTCSENVRLRWPSAACKAKLAGQVAEDVPRDLLGPICPSLARSHEQDPVWPEDLCRAAQPLQLRPRLRFPSEGVCDLAFTD